MDNIKELFDKSKDCETAEELVALCKEYDYEISLNDAEILFNKYDEGEVADEKMDLVSGGDSIFLGDKPENNVFEVPFNFLRADMYVYAYPKSRAYVSHKGTIVEVYSSIRVVSIRDRGSLYQLPESGYRYYVAII